MTFLNIENFGQLIRNLEQEGLLNREVEFLSALSELSRRALVKQKITRPELAVLLSYSKMSVERQLMGSTIAEDKYFEKYLSNYFPRLMRDRFRDQILNHPLKNEIIVTVIANKLVNQRRIDFVFELT